VSFSALSDSFYGKFIYEQKVPEDHFLKELNEEKGKNIARKQGLSAFHHVISP
jgi:hypothetical protein